MARLPQPSPQSRVLSRHTHLPRVLSCHHTIVPLSCSRHPPTILLPGSCPVLSSVQSHPTIPCVLSCPVTPPPCPGGPCPGRCRRCRPFSVSRQRRPVPTVPLTTGRRRQTLPPACGMAAVVQPSSERRRQHGGHWTDCRSQPDGCWRPLRHLRRRHVLQVAGEHRSSVGDDSISA